MPKWRGDGRELFFVQTDGMLVIVTPDAPGVPTPLFRLSGSLRLEGETVAAGGDPGRERIGPQPGLYTDPSIAPDGTRVTMTFADEVGSTNIRIWDLNRRNWTFLTEESSENEAPVWTLDARRMVFSFGRNGRFNHLFMQRADGIGEAKTTLPR
jgi:Tol biopolymer transport system component